MIWEIESASVKGVRLEGRREGGGIADSDPAPAPVFVPAPAPVMSPALL